MVSERLIFRNAKARDVLRECLKMESKFCNTAKNVPQGDVNDRTHISDHLQPDQNTIVHSNTGIPFITSIQSIRDLG
jgi:hypothetical protein